MKQKLALSCALVHRPDILFLDEPTTGVDAVSRREFWDLLADLKASGLTIVVSTPYMDEAEYCDRVSIMVNGGIAALGTPEELKEEFGASTIEEVFIHLARRPVREQERAPHAPSAKAPEGPR
jgi:ABC-2 type transport system ATP-binding protein